MKYLFFDTETTGLPQNWKAPASALNNWPRLVQLAYTIYDDNGTQVAVGNHIIKPEGFTIPEESTRIHGITHEQAVAEGEPLEEVLATFRQMMKQSNILVAHNIAFDEKIMGAEFIRTTHSNPMEGRPKICTMESTTAFCAIPSSYGLKYPSLQELHKKLFNTGFEDAHDAFVDVNATVRCFFELHKRGMI